MISCDCSVCIDNPSSVSRQDWVVARKPHTCCECGEVIAPKQRYERYTGCWDGDWATYNTCKTCVAIRDRYCFYGSVFGKLAAHLMDCLDFDYREVPTEGDDDQ